MSNEQKKFYESKELKKLFSKPSWFYFVPIIGYHIFGRRLITLEEKAGLLDTNTPGGKSFMAFMDKYSLSLNVLLPIWTFLCSLLFNFSFFIWKRACKKAIKLNEEALLYRDFASF